MRLRNPDTEIKFKETIKNKFHDSECKSEIDKGDWNPLKQIILAVSDEVLGIEYNKRRNNWYDNECEEATKEKNKVYNHMIKKHYTRRSEEKNKGKR